ncbi:MAG: Inner membrane protein, KefB/KefC family [uncultured Sphingomonas sp.]|uniref:Inner membrane protein, KefB/KefC family n=1 Tax=uncultured Sphingomonas sp. TaxID=158754 RepID=A0A6J4SRK3_9SPHN|nr:MAG: Inner membrane protein, KefB/KefC family [uncultured Sphingomonas sp.]
MIAVETAQTTTTPAENAAATTAIIESGAIMLGAALFFVIIFRRLKLGATLGYIVAGALIGPQALGLIGDPQQLLSITDIGIALLLFIVGLELQPSRLWRLRRDIFGLGLAQVVLCGIAITAVLFAVADLSLRIALAIGLPLALSSTAQVLPMLRSDNDLNTPQGERAFSVLLFQDLSIIPLITIIAAMSAVPVDPGTPGGWMMALYTVLAIAGLIAAGHFLLNPLFRLIGRFGERELFIVAALFTVVGASAVMHLLHLSVALGAFVAGVMLAESPYRHEIESDVEPFRSILLGLFFLSVGMVLELQLIASRPLFVIGIAAAVILTKSVVIAGLARLFGNSWPRSVRLGLLLSQAGEFGFVLFAQATAARLITEEAASLFSAVVTLSMATTPFLMRLTDWLERREERGGEGMDGPELSPETNAIVVGYGRYGQTVAQMLMAKRIPVTIIDADAEQIEVSEEFGTKVYYGDGTRIDLLRTAGADTAEAILFCHDSRDLTRAQLEGVLESFPHAQVLVRVYDRRQIVEFAGIDVAFMQRELFESAVVMGRQALLKLGVPEAETDRVEHEYRQRDCERLELQRSTGDLYSGRERIFGVDRPMQDEEVPG